MNIKILFTLLLLFTLPSAYAQKVKLKNDVIYVDGEAAFSYAKRTHGTEIVVYTLNTKTNYLRQFSILVMQKQEMIIITVWCFLEKINRWSTRVLTGTSP